MLSSGGPPVVESALGSHFELLVSVILRHIPCGQDRAQTEHSKKTKQGYILILSTFAIQII